MLVILPHSIQSEQMEVHQYGMSNSIHSSLSLMMLLTLSLASDPLRLPLHGRLNNPSVRFG